MSQQPIDGIGGIKKAGPGGDQAAILKPGEFVVEELGDGDIEGRAMGDGVLTPQQVAARFMALNAGKDAELAQFAGSENAALFGAEMALRGNANNRHLLAKRQSADRPIPQGEEFTLRQSELKKALAPFKGKLDDLRQVVASMQPAGETTSAQTKTLGRVPTPGLGLPIDPNI